jgi:hypothetical protein
MSLRDQSRTARAVCPRRPRTRGTRRDRRAPRTQLSGVHSGPTLRARVERRPNVGYKSRGAIAVAPQPHREQYSTRQPRQPSVPSQPKAPFAWIAIAAGLAAATIWLGLENRNRAAEVTAARGETRIAQARSEELGRALNFLRDPQTRPAPHGREAMRRGEPTSLTRNPV